MFLRCALELLLRLLLFGYKNYDFLINTNLKCILLLPPNSYLGLLPSAIAAPGLLRLFQNKFPPKKKLRDEGTGNGNRP